MHVFTYIHSSSITDTGTQRHDLGENLWVAAWGWLGPIPFILKTPLTKHPFVFKLHDESSWIWRRKYKLPLGIARNKNILRLLLLTTKFIAAILKGRYHELLSFDPLHSRKGSIYVINRLDRWFLLTSGGATKLRYEKCMNNMNYCYIPQSRIFHSDQNPGNSSHLQRMHIYTIPTCSAEI